MRMGVWLRLFTGLVAGTVAAAVALPIAMEVLAERVIKPGFYEHSSATDELPEIDAESDLYRLYAGQVHDPQTDHGIPYEEVAFEAPDGAVLRGWLVPARGGSDVAIATVHGAWMDRRDFLRRLPMLHEGGYAVLLFDCREHGTSGGAARGATFGQREREDVAAAVRYLREDRGYGRVGVFGESQGAAAAVLAAAEGAAIDALVLESTFATLRSGDLTLPGMQEAPDWLASLLYRSLERKLAPEPVYPLDRIRDVAPRPVLILHGTGDELIPFEHARRLHAEALEPKRLWIAPYAPHNAIVNLHPAEYERRVLSFLEEHLPVRPAEGARS